MKWRFDDILTFMSVIEAGSITSAAARLKISKSDDPDEATLANYLRSLHGMSLALSGCKAITALPLNPSARWAARETIRPLIGYQRSTERPPSGGLFRGGWGCVDLLDRPEKTKDTAVLSSKACRKKIDLNLDDCAYKLGGSPN